MINVQVLFLLSTAHIFVFCIFAFFNRLNSDFNEKHNLIAKEFHHTQNVASGLGFPKK